MNPAETATLPSGRPSVEQVFLQLEAAALELGFDFCVHGLRMPLPVTRPHTVYLTNYPPEWQARYKEMGYLQTDPIVAHGMRSSDAVVWSDAFFAKAPNLWKDAQAHGLRHGWAKSYRDPEGTFSLLVLARGENPITTDELVEKEPAMMRLVQDSHVKMKACSAPEFRRPDTELSDREIDVLRWTADGKTSGEIADILRISERTVNFHVNNFVEKLGASNKINAAVRAATLGLIW